MRCEAMSNTTERACTKSALEGERFCKVHTTNVSKPSRSTKSDLAQLKAELKILAKDIRMSRVSASSGNACVAAHKALLAVLVEEARAQSEADLEARLSVLEAEVDDYYPRDSAA